MINCLKKFNAIDSNKQNLKKRLKRLMKKIPDTSKFIVAQDFNRLIKIIFNVRIVEASKSLKNKKQVENALDLEHKNRE